MSDESHHERELGGQLLASVSRSFYLTLKALPKELREPISLAYLLARTADTIADTASVPTSVRIECLNDFETLVQSSTDEAKARLTPRITSDFVSRQSDEAERRLMERFSDGFAWLSTMRGAPLAAIQQVLQRIIHGQRLDIQRFPADGILRCLSTEAELDEYTWLVAGCVGEFWTEMCALEKPDSFDPSTTTEQMKAWRARFGKGLQLINILRDLGEDLRDGRCYLPGFTAEEVQRDNRLLQPAWQHQLSLCRAHLDSGLSYIKNVTDSKLRYATALPLLIGVKTLARMEKTSWETMLQGVKVSRLDIAVILAEAAIACRSAESVERLYHKLNRA
jgi:farnesyl-diphosphate farnesyltransferase